jgi:hypothetical protein
MGFIPDKKQSTGFTPDSKDSEESVSAEVGENKEQSNILVASGKSLSSGFKEMMAPGVKNTLSPLNPINDIATRVIESAYQESKRPALDALPSQSKLSRTATSIGIDILSGALAETGMSTANLTKNFLKTKPMASDKELISSIVKASKQIYNKTAQLLRPSDIAEYIGKEKTHPAVIEVSNIIKKSKNPEIAISDINKTTNELFSKRNALITKNNKLVQPQHLTDLSNYIDDVVNNGTATDAQIKAMNNVLKEEAGRFEAKKFDLLSAQQKKEFYQGMAKRVYNAGGMDELTTGVQQAYTVLAKSAKEIVENSIPEIKAINSRYEGLIGGRDMLAKLQKKMIENPDEALSVITETIGRPSKRGMVAAAIRKVPVVRDWGTYKHVSGKIEKLNSESEAMRNLLKARIKAASVK